MNPDTRIISFALIIVLTPIFVAALIYVAGSFTAADTNTANWTVPSRVAAVFVWLGFGTVLTGIMCACAEDQYRKFDRLMAEENQND